MTWILMGATFAVLTVLGVSCRRARLDLEEQLCECLQAPVAAAVGFGAAAVEAVPAPPVLIRIDGGGRRGGCTTGQRGERHLRVVSAR
jgi:hypothetical protein